MNKPSKGSSGGQNAQRGVLFQNSIAATHLFELLIGANHVWSVTCESREYVDDIRIDRKGDVPRYYQVKDLHSLGTWTVKRLLDNDIIQSFCQQLRTSAGECELVLASPLPGSVLSQWSESAKACSNLDQFVHHSCDLHSKDWQLFSDSVGDPNSLYQFLRCYFEEPWPPTPEHIRNDCIAAYRHSRYAATNEVWHLLRDIAAAKATRGRPITRTDLLALLSEMSPLFREDLAPQINIQDTRYTASPAWYVHRAEEWHLLSAVQHFLRGEPSNVLVVGEGGIGKSSFFSWMIRELEAEEQVSVLPVTAQGGDPVELVRQVNSALRARLRSSEPSATEAVTEIDPPTDRLLPKGGAAVAVEMRTMGETSRTAQPQERGAS
jgi:hypothetical protein